jgi:hypothetical protein
MLIPVLIAILAIAIAAYLFFRWFQRYRYTDAWRHSDLRDWAFGFLMWFGGLFGHRLPPPPQTKIEFATKARADGESGRAAFSEDASKEEE